MASVRQIHSGICLFASNSGSIGEGDALITARPGLAVSVRTADCLPILLADSHRRAVAAIHAGWRGTVSRIVSNTIEEMGRRFDTSPGDIFAAIGPGIGPCCYHVGAEVAAHFGLNAPGKVDLAEANRSQLMASGVKDSRIAILRLCTRCDPERFHSFRRDQDRAGRMISYIQICG